MYDVSFNTFVRSVHSTYNLCSRHIVHPQGRIKPECCRIWNRRMWQTSLSLALQECAYWMEALCVCVYGLTWDVDVLSAVEHVLGVWAKSPMKS
jgi:hypothetical protein